MDNQIRQAVRVLNNGGIIIFPTDTAFGIGCRMDEPFAIEKLFKLRNRPLTQATPVLVSGIDMAKDYLLLVSEDTENLMKKYWPGALTIVYPCDKNRVPELVRGGGNNLGVRAPDHPIILEIIRNVGVPILGPSANLHREKTPYKFEDLDKNLIKNVDFVVSGECKFNQASTVIDCSKDPWKILRKGKVEIKI
jgi:L-threonylcarbamoyladenylate synthase